LQTPRGFVFLFFCSASAAVDALGVGTSGFALLGVSCLQCRLSHDGVFGSAFAGCGFDGDFAPSFGIEPDAARFFLPAMPPFPFLKDWVCSAPLDLLGDPNSTRIFQQRGLANLLHQL